MQYFKSHYREDIKKKKSKELVEILSLLFVIALLLY